MLIFREIDVSINRTGIMAESATINTQNLDTDLFSLGYKKPVGHAPQGPMRSTIQFNYFIDVGKEPNYDIVRNLKDQYSNFNPFDVCVGNLTGTSYLSAFSVRPTQNDLLRATVEYTCFDKISGSLLISDGSITYNPSNYSGILHGNSVTFQPTQNYVPVYDFNYDFRANWTPVYTLGRKTPSQVLLASAEEQFSFSLESYNILNYTGNYAKDFLGLDYVRFYPPKTNITNNYIEFNWTGALARSTSFAANLEDINRTSVAISRGF